MRNLWPVVFLALPAQADAPSVPAESTPPECRIVAGEVVTVRDPRFRQRDCYIEPGVTLRIGMGERPSEGIPVRVRIELHPSCTPRPNEAEVMARIEAQTRAFVRERGVGDEGIEVLPSGCRPQRGVELVVVEVR